MRLVYIKYCAVMILMLTVNIITAQTISQDDDFVESSILITSVGKAPYQITGHAAIRMKCDSLGIDRVFTFDNNAGSNLKKLYYDGAVGKVFEWVYKDYENEIVPEGRQLTAMPLNLSLEENIRLWEVLDSVKFLPERPFDIVDSHCFSALSEILEESLIPAKVNFEEVASEYDSYSEIALGSGGDANPWNYMLIMLALGNKADEKGAGGKFIYPTTALATWDKFRITAPDGSWKPLFSSEPQVIIPARGVDKANQPVPTLLSLIILGVVTIVTGFQFAGRWNIAGKILDWILWTLVTAGGIFIVLITYMPHHYGGNWNWPLIVCNPIAWLPFAIFRQTKIRIVFWILYAVILIWFAIFIGAIAPSIITAWRIIALALAVRCTWHAISNNKKVS